MEELDLNQLLKHPKINTKIISERIHVGLRTVQNYANGSQQIPEPIKRLIKYEFSDYLPEGEGLIKPNSNDDQEEFKNQKVSDLEVKNANLQKRIDELENDKKILTSYVKSLEQQLGLGDSNKQTA